MKSCWTVTSYATEEWSKRTGLSCPRHAATLEQPSHHSHQIRVRTRPSSSMIFPLKILRQSSISSTKETSVLKGVAFHRSSSHHNAYKSKVCARCCLRSHQVPTQFQTMQLHVPPQLPAVTFRTLPCRAYNKLHVTRHQCRIKHGPRLKNHRSFVRHSQESG